MFGLTQIKQVGRFEHGQKRGFCKLQIPSSKLQRITIDRHAAVSKTSRSTSVMNCASNFSLPLPAFLPLRLMLRTQPRAKPTCCRGCLLFEVSLDVECWCLALFCLNSRVRMKESYIAAKERWAQRWRAKPAHRAFGESFAARTAAGA